MATTPPALTNATLGPATLARKWVLFVDTAAAGSTDRIWTQVMGTMGVKPTTDANIADTTDRDSQGDKSGVKTSRGWGVEGGCMRKTKSATVLNAYDPGQEFLRMKGEKIGLDNVAHIMIFEDNGPTGPKVQAYEGDVTVEWDEDSDGLDDPSDAAFTLTGVGKRTQITHPLAA